ncbi:transcription factor cmr1 [Grosmannia clavigera kw1407]|uniref:Transcription factor cmr1 n=1 Tax=Grosmannia clavigera (strain kw1407 / UAMH 11150) TaxID=655863 RepID=F0XGQ8_GROCL|nr:transcription factor cmr1 [Grosmannia clavigera kw1407]EFX03282.1 transcription factor cmr1 [Grosmannia clavigera kw1407]
MWTDTNVKPHRCSACQLSFARRDLLQRHHSTYHEARDPMEPLPGGVPTVAGRTPIACQNCANAKTGCDKRVPCSRCAEKNLPCAARFARRSSKAAVRAAQANAAAAAAFTAQMVPVPSPPQPGPPLTPAFIELDLHAAVPKADSPIRSPLGLDHLMVGGATGVDMCLPDNSGLHQPSPLHQQLHHHAYPPQKKSPAHTHGHLSPEDFSSPHGRIETLDEFMGFGATTNEFIGPETSFQDLIWTEYHMDLDMYPHPMQLTRPGDLAPSALVPPFTAATELSDMSSSSEPMTVSSSRNSVHTRCTSIFSTGDNDGASGSGVRGVSGGSGGHMHEHRGSVFKPSTVVDLAAMVPAADGGIPEFEVVVASDAAWPLARCNPPIFSGSCPRTAIVHLECLEHKSKQEGTWGPLEHYLDGQPESADAAQVMPLTSRSREKMLAITQSFLHKALDIHRSGLYPKSGISGASSPTVDFNFLVLPPSRILEYFLRNYVHSLAIYYPLVVGGIVDPNEMLDNNQASTLLVLLMIAQGAASVPMAEARYLSAGLSETCRISLFDIIEKNVELSADPLALRCALLFTLLGAWGGDKWHMDIAMGQRSMYLSMLKHAGMLEPQPSMVPSLGSQTNTELQWRSWLHREAQNRLVYNWVMVDQELSLFHDTTPVLSISDLQCPLPSPDVLWLAPTADRWLATAQSLYGCTAVHTHAHGRGGSPMLVSSALTPSLCDVFQDFLHDNLARRKSSLTPQLLRLLLHPLQTLLGHLRTMLSCLSDVTPTRRTSNRTVTKASTLQRLEEAQAQLQQWYELSMAYCKANPDCGVTHCNLVLYHLISLNAVTNFPEVERLARRDGLGNTPFWDLALRHKLCILQREEAIFHCGQVLRLLRPMALNCRPSWWSTALYRAVLILWADSVCRLDPNFEQQRAGAGMSMLSSAVAAATTTVAAAIPSGSVVPAGVGPSSGANPGAGSGPGSVASASSPVQAGSSPGLGRSSNSRSSSVHSSSASLVAIDQVTPEDQAVITYLWQGDGIAVLTRLDGTHFTLDKPTEILTYGVRRIEETRNTRIGDGIRRKLMTLATNWAGQTGM